MKAERYPLPRHSDERGTLTAVEGERDVPFPIRRIYYIYEVDAGAHRGYHAHKTLKQLLICVHGSCRLLLDNGLERQVVRLSDPAEGLYIGEPIWREMFDFSPGAVLLALVSAPYDPSDYIRDYGEFLEYIRREQEGVE